MNRRGRKDLPPGRFPPGVRGRRRPADAIGRRRSVVETLYLRTQSIETTARLVREHCKQLGIDAPSLSTVKRDVAALRERWSREASEVDPVDMREQTLRSILADLEQARLAKRWHAVTSLQRLVCEIRGMLIERKQVAIAHTNVSSLRQEPRAVLEWIRQHGRMPDEQERAALLALPAKKAN